MVYEHGLQPGDVVASKRRETDMEVQDVTDLYVDFGGDVGEVTHESVAVRLDTGVWEVRD